MLVELIENGIEAEKRRQQEFSSWPRNFATLPIRKRQNDSAISWAAWFLAADAQDRKPGMTFRQMCVNTLLIGCRTDLPRGLESTSTLD